RRHGVQPRRTRAGGRRAARQRRRHPRRPGRRAAVTAGHHSRCCARAHGRGAAEPSEGHAVTAIDADAVWKRPGLSIRDRRFVTIVCVAAAVDVPATDAQVYAALHSGDLSIEQMNELTLHFAVYCGWPKASQLETCVRAQWQRMHEERGEPVPAFPERSLDGLGPADPARRIADGIRSFEEINLVPAPPADSP